MESQLFVVVCCGEVDQQEDLEATLFNVAEIGQQPCIDRVWQNFQTAD